MGSSKMLLRICRTCCNKIVRDRHYVTPKNSTEYLEEIKSLFGYNLSNDKVNVHLPDLCNRCQRKLDRVRYFKGNVEHVHMVTFDAHTDDMCKICLLAKLEQYHFKIIQKSVSPAAFDTEF